MPDVTKVENALYEIQDYVTITEVMEITGVTRQTLITWCVKYQIGRKVGGRWYIDPDKLALLLKGEVRSKRL